MKTKITSQQWDLVDLNLFREKLPELKFCETASIEAIAADEPTDLIQYLKKQDIENFNKRLKIYSDHLLRNFKSLEDRIAAGEQIVTKKKIL